VAVCVGVTACGRRDGPAQEFAWPSGESAAIDEALASSTAGGTRDGLAAAILIDVSGSMARAAGDSSEPKIVSARRAALDVVDQFSRYAADHPSETVMLGIYEFSARDGQPEVRDVIPMGALDRPRAAAAVAAMIPNGGTPIGDAMIAGTRALDATGLTRRHLLVVTDGENTDGPPPGLVAAAIGRRAETARPALYFVAFDVKAQRFADVRDAGALVLEAANSRGLAETFDTLIRGQILVER
jgi:hypothetical protein